MWVSSAGVLSVPSIGSAYYCCKYVMACSANSNTYLSNSFQIYVNWAGMCNNDESGRGIMDISPSSNPPNKYYVKG